MMTIESILILTAGIGWMAVVESPSNNIRWVREGKPAQVEVLQEPRPGDRVELRHGSVSLFSAPDRVVTFEGTGSILIQPGGRWTTEGRVRSTDLVITNTELASVLKAEAAPAGSVPAIRSPLLVQLVYPVSTAVEEQRPTFRWRESLVGSVRLEENSSEKPRWQKPVSGTQINFPADEPPLDRGREFCWNLSNAKGQPIEEACFRIVSGEEARQMEIIKRAVSERRGATDPKLCLAAASFLARQERLPAAAEILASCGDAPTVRTALATIRQRIGIQ